MEENTTQPLERLKKYKNIYKYAMALALSDGITVCHDKNFFYEEEDVPFRLPNIIIWFRETLEKNDQDVAGWFNWDDDWREDFYSWGSNSRWGRTFSSWISCYILDKDVIEIIANIAEEFGDPSIEELYPIKKD